ncbi:MAG: hypothetical protein QOJ00_714 [Actinomycetota bacterium]
MSDFDAPITNVDDNDAEGLATQTDEPVVVSEPVAPDSDHELAKANPNDGYAFAAIICAIAGFVIPILPAAAALMLVRATEIAEQPLSEGAARLASAARTLAYVSLALISIVCAALLLGILGRMIS